MTDHYSYSLVVTDPLQGEPTVPTMPPKVVPGCGEETLARHIETLKDADWNKANYRLSVEFGVPPLTVGRIRKLLGNSRQHESWDWSKQNCELAEQHGVTPGTVSNWRRKLGKPVPSNHCVHRNRPADKYESMMDWTKRDVVLGREFGMTRERVRQLRLRFGKPQVAKMGDDFLEFKKIYGSTQEVDADEAGKQLGRDRATITRWCGYLNLPFKRKAYSSKYRWSEVDWRMPNPTIAEIWGIPELNVRARRWNNALRLTEWRKNSRQLTPEQIAVVNRQKELAMKGVAP